MMQMRLFEAGGDETQGDQSYVLGDLSLREAYTQFVRPVKAASKATLGCDLAAIGWFEKLLPDLATVPVLRISTRDISVWRSKWAETGLTPQTWNKHARHIKAIFRELYDQDLLHRLPRFKALPEADPVVRIASPLELQRLLDKCRLAKWPRPDPESYWRSAIVFGVSTGLRRRDLLSLRKADIDFERRQVTYRARKTGKLRVIPVSEECLTALRGQIKHSWGENIWYSTNSPRQWYREWKRIQAAAGIQGGLLFHDLRSTCGSRVYRIAGLAAASEILAHSSLAVTRRHYISTEVASESLRPVVDRLSVVDTIPAK